MNTRKNNNHGSYFERITFDTKLTGDAIWNYISNMRIVILSVIAIVFLGFVSYLSIPRRLNPEIKISIVTVITALPGASPSDVESLVTIPLEKSLQNIAGIDTLTSTSRDNVSAITLQFLSSVPQDKAKADVQSAVDATSGLPKDALTPQVKALDFEDEPIWTFALTAPDLPSLMRMAELLKKNIENTPRVDRVIVSGFEKQEIAVEIRPEAIRQYSINPAILSSQIRSAIVSYPAGTVETSGNTFSLAIDPQITSIADIRNQTIRVGQSTIALGDIAVVREQSALGQRAAYEASRETQPRRVVIFNVHKSGSANIDEAAHVVEKTVTDTLTPYGDSYTVTTITNAAEEIDDQFFDLLGEFRSTILLVFACLFVFLGLRQAIIASLTVPLTFLAAFVFMRAIGMSINFLSMFAFLLALGLLVDDTIVVVSAMTSYFKTKKFTPQQTGRIVWRDTIIPIWSTTITTIWSFVPLLLASGIIGEFIKPIPVVVTVTMISSTAIAVLITLPFMIVILKPEIADRIKVFGKIVGIILASGIFLSVFKSNQLFPIIAVLYLVLLFVVKRTYGALSTLVTAGIQNHKGIQTYWPKISRFIDHGMLDIEVIAQKYHWLITKILHSKKSRRFVLFAIIFYAIWAFALLPLGFVKNEFFPKDDSTTLYINVEYPLGTNVSTTSIESLQLLEKFRHIPESDFVTLSVGSGQGSRGGSSGDSIAGFTIHLKEKEDRRTSSIQIAEALREQYARYTKGKVSIVEVSGGPPAGSDLQMQLYGDDLAVLNRYADTLVTYLNTQQGVGDVQKSIKTGTSKLVFIPDQQKLNQYGLTPDSVALWLRSFASGFTLSDAKFDTSIKDKKDIVFSFSGGAQSPDTIGAIMIPTTQGSVPLVGLGTIRTASNPTAITREGGKRTITVSASVRAGFNTTQKNSDLEKFAAKMNMENGYGWKTGGVNDENRKSVQSILQAMVLAFILILVTMVVQFQSYRQAVLVLLVIPLAVSSVFFVFALTGTPLSFPALIGVLSLFGIVVTNSMFIVDKINMNLKEGMPFTEAIADAGTSRMEPIILTKLCTVFGLLPVTLASALWQGLGGAIISGLLIASTIMLLFIPVVYYEWFKGDYRSSI